METIDMTPTWQGILPYYLAVLQDGNDKGQGIAKAELLNMAKAADAYNELLKEPKPATKSLIITGVYQLLKDSKLVYEVTLFGQSDKIPQCTYIRALRILTETGYNDMVRQCKDVFAEYFETDEKDITLMDTLTEVFNLA